MPTGVQSEEGRRGGSSSAGRPELCVCESAPGTAVFIESGNCDGWIAIADPVEVTR
ncbi:hypothetical protein U4E84_15735 [Halorubrum sp. AD140]|uniref:hypothetical protein n=1 Tax=Halorubrum sp. AD140 TaxID=3050073 RepID=UPI002ACD0C2F|nr:hypothetical protein [Halorubrum sp. AD140]MDZ5812796.1 hypothetical protein [Halorubrum sp. AD140]